MAEREIKVTLRVKIPEGADAYTAERLIWEASQEASRRALGEVAEDGDKPTACPRCEKGGSSGTGRSRGSCTA